MFRAFFTALKNLTASVDTLTASVKEATTNFRANLGLDNPMEPEQLDYAPKADKRKGVKS